MSVHSPSNRHANAPHRVAIVAWQALPAIFPDLGDRVGGMETAAWTFATSLAEQSSWDPVVVFRSARRLTTSSHRGVELFPVVEPWEQIRRDVSECLSLSPLRLKRFDGSLLWKIPALALSRPFRKRDARPMAVDPRLLKVLPQVWIAMGVNQESAGVIATAKSQGTPSVLMIRSGVDLDERYASDEVSYSPYGERSDVCAFALRSADLIVCQAQWQQEKLKRIFGRDSALIRNPIDRKKWNSDSHSVDDRDGVLWIGRYDNIAKRIELAIEIAKRCPDHHFRLIANRDDGRLEQQIRAYRPANVELIDYVPPDEMPKWFGRSRVFLSTSSQLVEGFPNVLLQAAATQTPIVSLDDFDGFIERSRAGTVCGGDVTQAAHALQSILSKPYRCPPEETQIYLNQYHDRLATAQQLAEELEALLRHDCEK